MRCVLRTIISCAYIYTVCKLVFVTRGFALLYSQERLHVMDDQEDSHGQSHGAGSDNSSKDGGSDSFMLMRTYLDKQPSSFKQELRDEIQS